MIRPATPEDAAALTEIYNYYIEKTCVTFETDPDDYRHFRDGAAEPGADAAAHRGNLCGGAVFRTRERRPRGRLLLCAPARAEGGIRGQHVMGKMIEECRTRGYRALFCLVTDDNEASKALCSRFGFERVGCLKAAGVKFGRPLDLGYYELLL